MPSSNLSFTSLTQAAVVSCLAFTMGALVPLLAGAFIADYRSVQDNALFNLSLVATGGLLAMRLTALPGRGIRTWMSGLQRGVSQVMMFVLALFS